MVCFVQCLQNFEISRRCLIALFLFLKYVTVLHSVHESLILFCRSFDLEAIIQELKMKYQNNTGLQGICQVRVIL